MVNPAACAIASGAPWWRQLFSVEERWRRVHHAAALQIIQQGAKTRERERGLGARWFTIHVFMSDGDQRRPTATATSGYSGWLRVESWRELVSSWVAARPTASNPAGLTRVREQIRARLERLGFRVHVHGEQETAPILIALRPPERTASWVGLYAHYDVEEVADGAEGWSSEPFTTRVGEGRIYGRGVGDDLGPLALRLVALEEARASGRETGDEPSHARPAREPDAFPGLLWVIQGEEELGSPWAHRLFPQLALPPVALWLEETGYFESDGTQRLLARRIPARLRSVLAHLTEVAGHEAREVRVHDRYLNKAFGASNCPFLTHLVGETPYLAIGPNDTQTRIHGPDESLPLDTLKLSADQFMAVLNEVARCT